MPKTVGNQIWKSFDWVLCKAAGVTFDTIQFFNKYNPNPSFTPKWSEKPLLKSWEKSKPTLGWPRTTDSLCPDCVREARDLIINGIVKTISQRRVTYDLERLMEGATKVKTSEFGDAIIENM